MYHCLALIVVAASIWIDLSLLGVSGSLLELVVLTWVAWAGASWLAWASRRRVLGMGASSAPRPVAELVWRVAKHMHAGEVRVVFENDEDERLSLRASRALRTVTVDDETLLLPLPLQRAAVAHEIGHLRQWGSTIADDLRYMLMITFTLATLATTLVLAVRGQWSFLQGVLVLAVIQGGLALLLWRAGTRRGEYRADLWAARFDYGPDLCQLISTFGSVPRWKTWTATHPSPSKRIAAIERYLEAHGLQRDVVPQRV